MTSVWCYKSKYFVSNDPFEVQDEALDFNMSIKILNEYEWVLNPHN